MGRRLTTEEFVERARRKHDYRYDYSLVEYKNSHTKVEIICKEHGSFMQKPNDHHTAGQGCPKCAGKYVPTTDEWITKAREVHGHLYDYSQVQYKNSGKKVEIICKEHGMFKQVATSHLHGRGCPRCASTAIPSTEEWTQEAIRKCGEELYDYSKSCYTNNRAKIEIICRADVNHGSFFKTSSNFFKGSGCPKCSSSTAVSRKEVVWLDQLEGITAEQETALTETKSAIKLLRQHRIGRYKVDGFDPETNTVYEFLGDFWHGNPDKFSPEEVNPVTKKKYGKLYTEWQLRKKSLQKQGYTVVEMWESDFDKKKIKNGGS